MKKQIFILCLLGFSPLLSQAQTAIEAINFTQSDLKGTARFMSMGGAFGALGGDLSSISVNPAGIGVYRSNEIGVSVGLDLQQAKSNSAGFMQTTNLTKFQLNNAGGVFTLKLNNNVVPNLNFAFTYNKTASFNRHVRGTFPQLRNSLSNYIAGVTNNGPYPGESWTENDLNSTNSFNAWNPNDGNPAAPWMSILGYEGLLITPTGDSENPTWIGQWGNGTSGNGQFEFREYGGIDSYNIAFGGNFGNVVYWGMDFDIINFNYGISSLWAENLKNAYVEADGGAIDRIDARWNLKNVYEASGSGFNYKLGVIVKPIQELRLGFSFQTPTWYSLTESYTGQLNFKYASEKDDSRSYNKGYPATSDMNFRTPWRLTASAAGVIGGRFIISADYEWANFQSMRFSEPTYNNGYYTPGYYDPGYNDWGNYYPYSDNTRFGQYISDPYQETNNDIHNYCQSSNTFRLGAEFRITPQFSVRAGYSYTSSPIKEKVRKGEETIYTSDTRPSFKFNNATNYITAGAGYKGKHLYADLAYVYKHQSSDYFAYPTDPTNALMGIDTTPKSSISFNNSQILLTLGVKF
ncbi:MAG: outer membrane protein transport protein [Muribaculaceae bacterium]|nr:outer membrane protein transport protein [Muribaculaceae bacterium]